MCNMSTNKNHVPNPCLSLLCPQFKINNSFFFITVSFCCYLIACRAHKSTLYLPISFTNSFIPPGLYSLREFQVTILISVTLFPLLWWQVVGLSPIPGAEWPKCNLMHCLPILVAFMNCLGCSGAILFPDHHMGNCVICITTQNNENPVLNIPSPHCNLFSVLCIRRWRKWKHL